ncbi:SRPBCC family protein [Colwellia sp. MEBiC06753]
MLKKFSIAVLVIILLPFIVAAFIKNSYQVERSVVINQPSTVVFNFVKYLKNQDLYSKWAKIDPDMKKSFRGTDGEVGFVSAWQSDNDEVGVGEQEIIAIKDGERIDYELRFIKPFAATSPSYMTIEPVTQQQTKVSWGFEGYLAYPMNLMFLFMDFEQIIGDDLQLGLNNLKEIQEQH